MISESTAMGPETLLALLDRLRELGVKLWLEDDRLRFRAPIGALTPDLKSEMKAHKALILDFLRQAQGDKDASGPPLVAVLREGSLPLSFAQQRLWLLEQGLLGEGRSASATYNVVDVVRLRGRFRADILGRSLDEIVCRHEVLRTTFPDSHGEAEQIVAPPAPVPLPRVDLTALPEPARAEESRSRVQDLAQRPFDLAAGPLLEAVLLRLSDTHHLLFLGMHHIVTDGWSSGVLITELCRLYEAFFARDSPESARTVPDQTVLPPLAVQYGDYAIWQRRWFESPTMVEQTTWWKQHLSGAEQVLGLLGDRPRPLAPSNRGAHRDFLLSSAAGTALDHLARMGTTRFMVLLGAFAVLLGRHAGQNDLLLGTPVAGRRRSELQRLIGFFVNTLVMRVEMVDDPSVSVWLGEVREQTLQAFDRQDVPFEKLVEELQPERDPSRHPLFQAMLVVQNAPQPELAVSGLVLEPVLLENHSAKFDLTLTLIEGEPPLVGSLEYATDLFDATTAARLTGQLERLLVAMAGEPAARLSSLALLGPADRAQLLHEWNDSASPNSASPLLHELIGEVAGRRPHAVAVVIDDVDSAQVLTYGELVARARRLAAALRLRGIGPESVVAVSLERSLELTVALLAILEAGAAYVPLDPSYPEDRLSWMLRDSGAKLEIDQRVFLDLVAEVAEVAGVSEAVRAHPENPAYVLYTSGSTGRPKGAVIPHRAIASHMLWVDEHFPLGPGESMLLKTPTSFDASVWEIFAPLAVGARLVLAPPDAHRDAALMVLALRRHDVTTLQLVPSQLRLLLEHPRLEDCTALRYVYCGGEALPWELADRLRGHLRLEVYNLYGPSEAAVNSTLGPVRRATPRGGVDLGRPRAGGRVLVVDRHGHLLPCGAAGELLIGGAGLGRGYLGRPALTAERFVPDPHGEVPGDRLYRTGDRVARWPESELEFLERLDHQVKLRGLRIELGEIETVLENHPAVLEAAAGIDGQGERQRLVAWVLAAQPTPVDLTIELGHHLRRHLPDYMVPSAFAVANSFPRSPSGKLDRRDLALRPPGPAVLKASGAAPRTPTEEVVASTWNEVLGEGVLGVDDNFFELGGHSLMAARIVARLEQGLGVAVPLRSLFEAPTIAGLAERIDRSLASGAAAAPPAIVPVPRQGPLPLSFSQERLWLFEQLVPGTAVYNTCRAGHLTGPLDFSALRETFWEILRRHEVLRTRYAVGEDASPIQRVEPHRRDPLPFVDLRGLEPGPRQTEVLRLGQREHITPMDISRAPLLRAVILAIEPEEHVVLLSIHHICWDLWSGGVLLREIEALYLAFVQRQPSPLAELPLQYGDYAVWQRQWFEGAVLESELDYWRDHLGDAARAPMSLPTDRPRPAREAFRGTSARFNLCRELAEGVRQLSQAGSATLFMTHLAIYEALLYRLAPQPHLLVGSAISNRNDPRLEGVIGFFDNMIALRTDTTDAATLVFDDFLARVRGVALGGYAHQHLPFEVLVQDLNLERDRGRAPLLQAIFLFQLNYPAMARRIADLEMKPYWLRMETSKFDFSFSLREGPAGLVGEIEYNTDLFDGTTVRRLIGHYQALATAVVADHQAARGSVLADLPLLGPAQAHQLRVEWNDRDGRRPDLVPARVAARAAARPEAPAVRAAGETLTYGELEQRAKQLARRLSALGVGPEVRVGVCLRRSVDLVVALYAVWKAGGAYMPLDPEYPDARLDFMLADAGAPVVISERHLAGRLKGSQAHRVLLNANLTEPGLTEPGSAHRASPDLRPSEPAPRQLAYVIYTSGSTGMPKGVEICHGALRGLVDWHLRAFGLAESDRTTHLAGLGFDASVWEVWPTLAVGGCLEQPDEVIRSAPEALRDWLVECRVTVSFLPTPLAEAVLDLEWPETTRLRLLLTGGDRLRRIPAGGLPFDLINNYGPTENTVVATSGVVATGGLGIPSIGRTIDGVTLRVCDRVLRSVPVGVPGELVIGGSHLARGYLERPALSAALFVPDAESGCPGGRLYRTGDLVRWLADGEIDFLGRLDEQVKVRGFRIELGEIEAALTTHPRVASCAVLAPETTSGSRRLVAWVVPAAEADITEERRRSLTHSLPHFLAQSLPEYMVPSAVAIVDQFPLTAHGKVDRKVLAQQVPTSEGVKATVAPRTPTEKILVDMWRDLLEQPELGIEDDFFAAGGHSLLATRMASRVRRALRIELPLGVVFDHPTVAGLATWIERADGSAGGSPAVDRPMMVVPVPRRHDVELPLSFAQERMWFLDQLQGGDSSYTIPAAVRLSGDLRPAALAAAAAALVRRHESLRTAFASVDGRPRQMIAGIDLPPVDFILVDSDRLPPDRRQAALARSLAAEVARPFNLETGPLLRLRLFRLGAEDYVLLVTLHHIVADGWSMGVVVSELAEFYGAAVEGRSPALAPLPVQYADVASAARRWLDEGGADPQLNWWRHQLENPPLLDLPADGPPTASSRGGRHRQSLGPELTGAVRELAAGRSASLFMTLATAFAVLLERYSGAKDLTLGYPIAGRRRDETQGLVGVFLNTLVLRVRATGRPSFEELLDQVRRAVLDADAHQDIPFEKLLDELKPERDLARTPLFQVFFNMLTFPSPPSSLGGLRMEPVPLGEAPAKFDLTLYAAEDGDDLVIDWVYKADRFGAERIAAMAGQMERILEQATADPAGLMESLDLRHAATLPDPSRRLERRWNDSVTERLEASASRHADQPAVAFAAGGWTYEELGGRAARLARALAERGVGGGDVVAVYARRSPELVTALWAILRSGAAFVILDAGYPTARLRRQLRLAQPKAWIPASAQEPPAELKAALADRVNIDRADGQPPAPVTVGPDDLAYLAFTSGSTGEPRAVEGPQAPLAHFIDWHTATFELTASDRFAMLSGLSHDPLLRDILTPLTLGAILHVPDESLLREPVALRDWLAKNAVTVVHMTPALARLLTTGVAADGAATLPALRYAFLGGDVLRGRDVEGLRALAPGVQVVNFYGATETPQAMAYQRIAADFPPWAPVPLGHGIEGADLLLRTSSGLAAGVGERAEIWVRSPYLALGYRGDRSATDERFVDQGDLGRLYRTGDLGRYESDGSVVFLGRIDDQVQLRGYRIEPGEVEQVLTGHGSVEQAAVVLLSHGDDDGRLVAYLVRDPSAPTDLTPDHLRSFLAAELPSHMIPGTFVVLDELPLTPNGKLDRRALPVPEEVRGLVGPAPVAAPRDALELTLVKIWEELLGTAPVGIHDDFFALGGHSLLAVRLTAVLRRRFGRDLPVSLLFQRSTVEKLAQHLRVNGEVDDGGILVPIRQGPDDRASLFCVHPIGGNVLCYAELASHLEPGLSFYALQSPGLSSSGPSSSDPSSGKSLEAMAAHYLEQVRAHTPQGPYRLAGWSMGGVVAYEMARQLVEAGQEVSFVGLIDSTVPSAVRPIPDDRALLLAFAADLASLFGLPTVLPEEVGDLTSEAVLKGLLSRAVAAGSVVPEMELEDLRRLHEIFRVNAVALAGYRPSAYGGRLTLFQAAEGEREGRESAWRKLAAEVDAEQIFPGGHYDLLKGENARGLAKILSQAG